MTHPLLDNLLFILSEGLTYGFISIGVYVAFQWLRYPDLTPDGSFVVGALAFAKAAAEGWAPGISIVLSVVAGMVAGFVTSILNRLLKLPAVVAGLLVASALYSINLMILGMPYYPLDQRYSLIGNVPLLDGGYVFLLVWLVPLCTFVTVVLTLFAGTKWGLRARAIGENPLIAREVGTTETSYTILCLMLANGIVGLAGAFFVNRAIGVDVNIGFGTTINGLSGMILGLLIAHKTQRVWKILVSILIGAIIFRALTFVALKIHLPASSFRLVAAAFLVVAFSLTRRVTMDFLKGLKWN